MSLGSWSAVLGKIRQEPRLTREEEHALVLKTLSGDEAAESRLVSSHLRFVLHLAHRYARHGLPVGDLLQEGTVGLMEAVRRFNPERGVRLSTYAVWWIRAAMQDYMVRSKSLVRVGTTGVQRAAMFGLQRRGADTGDSGAEAVNEELAGNIAARFNTSVAEVVNFARKWARPDISLHARAGDGSEERWIDRLIDEAPSPEDIVAKAHDLSVRIKALMTALKSLPPRERHIIQSRFFSEPAPSRAAVGAELGLSKERVRQLEVRALTRLRSVLQPVA